MTRRMDLLDTKVVSEAQASQEDAMIAATAQVHGLIVVTRNVRDLQVLGSKTLNPFR